MKPAPGQRKKEISHVEKIPADFLSRVVAYVCHGYIAFQTLV